MWVLKGILAAAVIFGSAALAPAAAEAQTAIEVDEAVDEVSGWRIGYSRRFAGCVTYTTFADNSTVWIGYSASFEFYVAFSNPGWRSLQAGGIYRLDVRPSGASKWNGDFVAVEARSEKALITSGLKRQFLEDLARAPAMAVMLGDRQITNVSLSGSRNALTSMLECQQERIDRSRADAEAASSAKPGKGRGRAQQGVGSGTGFFVSSAGHVLTNHHVAGECKSLDVSFVGGVPQKAILVASDAKNDLALLATSLKPRAVPAFRPRIRVGENVFVYGFPLTGVLASTGNFTMGIVTAMAGIRDDISQLQISATVQPGNSGGPLIDKSGRIVGVIVSKLKREIGDNANFAIKSSVAATFLEVNGVEPRQDAPDAELEGVDIADKAKDFTVHVVCNRPG